uniref:NADH-ubiquinone oxidoreductase chain 1 n=1 Tax=Colobus angolensis palliatus TaxID=336983 RepID=A0A2K5HLL7_COLAP
MLTTNLLLVILPIMAAIAFLTLTERKLLGYIQLRKGPNIVGPYGLLQPFADAIKLFTKEPLKPSTSTTTLYVIAPALAFSITWTHEPTSPLPL